MKVYHYTNTENWSGIKKTGLSVIPGSIGKFSQGAESTAAAFAFLNPEPGEWMNSSYFPDLWGWFKDLYTTSQRFLLLEMEIDPRKSKGVKVADWAHMESFLKHTVGIPQKYVHDSAEEAERAYIQTMVSLDKYMDHKREPGFALPEVVITDTIPAKRIILSESQPFLKEFLENGRNYFDRQYFLTQELDRIPELAG